MFFRGLFVSSLYNEGLQESPLISDEFSLTVNLRNHFLGFKARPAPHKSVSVSLTNHSIQVVEIHLGICRNWHLYLFCPLNWGSCCYIYSAVRETADWSPANTSDNTSGGSVFYKEGSFADKALSTTGVRALKLYAVSGIQKSC